MEALKVTAFFYFFINFISALGGVITRVDHMPYSENYCDTPPIRIGYLFPGFRAGCWLGAEVTK
jgi:hypothetical protein